VTTCPARTTGQNSPSESIRSSGLPRTIRSADDPAAARCCRRCGGANDTRGVDARHPVLGRDHTGAADRVRQPCAVPSGPCRPSTRRTSGTVRSLGGSAARGTSAASRDPDDAGEVPTPMIAAPLRSVRGMCANSSIPPRRRARPGQAPGCACSPEGPACAPVPTGAEPLTRHRQAATAQPSTPGGSPETSALRLEPPRTYPGMPRTQTFSSDWYPNSYPGDGNGRVTTRRGEPLPLVRRLAGSVLAGRCRALFADS